VRYLAIGDIHGCFEALKMLEEFVPIRADDVVVTLGDYVNRGPNSRAVLDWLIARKQTGKLQPLRGNHEVMMLAAQDNDEAFRAWLGYGGDATLSSYAMHGHSGSFGDIPVTHWQFLEQTLPWFETESHIFVHAGVYPDRSLEEQPDYMLYWEPFEDRGAHESGKIVVCGHSSQRSGRPLDVGHSVCIDTWACGRGWLTCLDVISRKYWQANQRGETRSDSLE
jgi:calcineurin-like phosphoesterase family protein